ncbi:hypothetical protein AHAS_Ahas06G0130600 [Arachis hypogaea]
MIIPLSLPPLTIAALKASKRRAPTRSTAPNKNLELRDTKEVIMLQQPSIQKNNADHDKSDSDWNTTSATTPPSCAKEAEELLKARRKSGTCCFCLDVDGRNDGMKLIARQRQETERRRRPGRGAAATAASDDEGEEGTPDRRPEETDDELVG